jgi:hypothetical protein
MESICQLMVLRHTAVRQAFTHLASWPLISNRQLSQTFLDFRTGLTTDGPVSLVAHPRRNVRVSVVLGWRLRQAGAVGRDSLAGEIGGSLGSLARGDALHGYLNVAWRQDYLGWGISQHVVCPWQGELELEACLVLQPKV